MSDTERVEIAVTRETLACAKACQAVADRLASSGDPAGGIVALTCMDEIMERARERD